MDNSTKSIQKFSSLFSGNCHEVHKIEFNAIDKINKLIDLECINYQRV